MKKSIVSLLVFSVFAAASQASTAIPVADLPEVVKTTLEEYFPGSEALSAKTDEDDGKVEYEVKIQYKEIQLEIDLSAEGKILDVDME